MTTNQLLKNHVSVRGPETRYPHTLGTVWEQNFKHLKKEASDLLKVLAFFDLDGVQEKMILEGAELSQDSRLEFVRTQKRLKKCRSAICRSGLVDRNSDLGQLIMHRLVSHNYHYRMSDKSSYRYKPVAYTRYQVYCMYYAIPW